MERVGRLLFVVVAVLFLGNWLYVAITHFSGGQPYLAPGRFIILVFISVLMTVWVASSGGNLIYSFFRPTYQTLARRLVLRVSCFLVAYGGFAFFLFGWLICLGIPLFGPNFEWPVGWVSGVARDVAGHYIVPTYTNRIQIYDPNRDFMRGWYVDAPRRLHVCVLDGNKIETWANQKHLVYDLNGKLLLEENEDREYKLLREQEEPTLTLYFPTRWWLWPFTNPAIAWLTVAMGGAGMWWLHWREPRGPPLPPARVAGPRGPGR